MELTLKEMLALFKNRFVFIIICTFVGLSSFYIINQYVIKPSYTAAVQMYVNPNDINSSANLNDLYYAQKVVTTYINFLQTKVFYSRVLDESQSNYTLNQLREMTEIKAVNNTEIFQISVTTFSAGDSYHLVEVMQNIAPELIREIKSSAEISVVDPVTFPEEPSRPNVLLNSISGGLIGLLLSIAISILWEMIDVNVKSQEELTKRYRKPILGAIPNYDTNIRSDLFQKILQKLKRKKITNDHVINEETKFITTEGYKALRTNLRYTICKEGCKKILINSPIPEDGKSTTCANIGITIAQTGAKVLLMDCDLRKGRLHSFFHIKSSPGVSDLLSGIMNERDAIQNTSYANLQVITMGVIPPNPTELLASNQMEELIKKLEKNYDYIIIDSPPVNVVSDALSLTKLVDGVIMVVREKKTSHPNITSALSKYEFVEAKILGFVLNGISLNQGSKSKSQYYYYRKSKND